MRILKGKLRRGLASFLAFCVSFTSFNMDSWAGVRSTLDNDNVVFVLSGEELLDSAQAAIDEGIKFDIENLGLEDENKSLKKDYEKLFGGNSVYEFMPNYDLEDEAGVDGAELRLFVRVPGAEEGYKLTGDEEIIFLYINGSESKVTFRSNIDGYLTQKIGVKAYSESVEALPEETLQPSETGEAEEIIKPSETGNSEEAEKPSETEKSTENSKPEESEKSEEAPKPEESEKSEEAPKPEEPGKSEEAPKPEEPGKSEESAKPDRGEAEDNQKPADEDKGSTSSKPDKTTDEKTNQGTADKGDSDSGKSEAGNAGDKDSGEKNSGSDENKASDVQVSVSRHSVPLLMSAAPAAENIESDEMTDNTMAEETEDVNEHKGTTGGRAYGAILLEETSYARAYVTSFEKLKINSNVEENPLSAKVSVQFLDVTSQEKIREDIVYSAEDGKYNVGDIVTADDFQEPIEGYRYLTEDETGESAEKELTEDNTLRLFYENTQGDYILEIIHQLPVDGIVYYEKQSLSIDETLFDENGNYDYSTDVLDREGIVAVNSIFNINKSEFSELKAKAGIEYSLSEGFEVVKDENAKIEEVEIPVTASGKARMARDLSSTHKAVEGINVRSAATQIIYIKAYTSTQRLSIAGSTQKEVRLSSEPVAVVDIAPENPTLDAKSRYMFYKASVGSNPNNYNTWDGGTAIQFLRYYNEEVQYSVDGESWKALGKQDLTFYYYQVYDIAVSDAYGGMDIGLSDWFSSERNNGIAKEWQQLVIEVYDNDEFKESGRLVQIGNPKKISEGKIFYHNVGGHPGIKNTLLTPDLDNKFTISAAQVVAGSRVKNYDSDDIRNGFGIQLINQTNKATILKLAITGASFNVKFVQEYTGTLLREDKSVPWGTKLMAPEAPATIIQNGETLNFIGWDTEAYENVTKDMVVTALYGAGEPHQVIYDVNGASGMAPTDTIKYKEGSPVLVKGSGTMKKSGAYFAGWNTQKDGKGIHYLSNDTFQMPGEDITLYAIWQDHDKYIITFDVQGPGLLDVGMSELLTKRIFNVTGGRLFSEEILQTEIPIPVPNDGARFVSWKHEQNTITSNENLWEQYEKQEILGDYTFVAVFTEKTGELVYNPNGGKGGPSSGEYTLNSEIELEFTPAPEKPGYEFIGWAKDKNAVQPEYTADGTKRITPTAAMTIVYAVWKERAKDWATVTFLPGAHGSLTGKTIHKVIKGSAWDSIIVPGIEASHGYSVSVNSWDKEFVTTVEADMTYTAQYEKDADEWVNVTFNRGSNGHIEGEDENGKVVVADILTGTEWGEVITVPAITPDQGWTEGGWSVLIPGDNSPITENMTFTAQYIANTATTYTVEAYYESQGVYSEAVTSLRTGTTNSPVELSDADKAAPSGYAFDERQDNVLGGIVQGDNSLVLKVYFKQQFNITYSPGAHGVFEKQVTEGLSYGDSMPEFTGSTTGDTNYLFTGWDKVIGSTVTENAEYVAQWNYTGSNEDDNPGGDNPGGDNPGGDNPGGDNPGGDNPGGDNPGGDNPGGNNPGGNNPGGNNPGGGNSGGGNSGGSIGGGNATGPGQGTDTIVIEPEDVPLASFPPEPTSGELITIDEGEVPLASLPKTGDTSSAGEKLMLIFTGMMMAVYATLSSKKRNDDEI